MPRNPLLPGPRVTPAPVSSDTFSDTDLDDANTAQPTVRIYRGSAKLAADLPGLIAASVNGARIIR